MEHNYTYLNPCFSEKEDLNNYKMLIKWPSGFIYHPCIYDDNIYYYSSYFLKTDIIDHVFSKINIEKYFSTNIKVDYLPIKAYTIESLVKYYKWEMDDPYPIFYFNNEHDCILWRLKYGL